MVATVADNGTKGETHWTTVGRHMERADVGVRSRQQQRYATYQSVFGTARRYRQAECLPLRDLGVLDAVGDNDRRQRVGDQAAMDSQADKRLL